ncbi:hypothetical protein SAMN04487910_1206 [Aquimarina amphilecti]|uniref:Uncharacterized protein n=1 Tax=Aquimarina amphilecti TaxID=1038014 RepID=A0A1H7K4R8_AQUAM|nr:hypothetical protein [Aquimarina amphilecti]SEK81911.1 hypothetical protein SAMN04487910_1206 [Aquimarina amphilecti]
MKIIKYIGILLFLVIINACTSDDDSNSISIEYEENLIETSFLEEGETIPPTINMLEENGTFSATTLPSSEEVDLVGNSIFINSETGVLSWNNSLPLGEINVFVTASNEFGTGSVTITINNVFTGRNKFMTGGFNNDTSDNPFSSIIEDNLLLQLRDDGVVTLLSEFDSTVVGSGNWKAEGNIIKVSYTHIDYPGENLVMKGVLSTILPDDPAIDSEIVFSGLWGKGLDDNDNIEELMGAFSFKDDF